MRAVMALHATLRLRRRSGDDTNAEFGAHASELRLGLDAFERFARRRLALVDVLPVAIQRLRNAVLTHPGLEQIGRRPSRLFAREAAQRPAGRIVDEVHQATFRAASFEPVVVRAVELDQLAEMRFALTPTAVWFALAAAAEARRSRYNPSP